MLYYAYIYSHLRYCILVWGDAGKTPLNGILLIQKRYMRILFGEEYNAPISHRFHELLILIIFQIFSYALGNFMYEHRKNGFRPNLPYLFTPFSDIHTYGTRFSDNYYLPKVKREQSKRSLAFKGARLWNSIPMEIKGLTSQSNFKANFKKYLCSNNVV